MNTNNSDVKKTKQTLDKFLFKLFKKKSNQVNYQSALCYKFELLDKVRKHRLSFLEAKKMFYDKYLKVEIKANKVYVERDDLK